MNPTITSAIIGAASAIAGAMLNKYAPDLPWPKVGSNADLISRWSCVWSVAPADAEGPIADVIIISKVRGEELWGEGINTQYGGYKLRGRVSRSSLVTFHYEGLRERQPLGGVVIMKLNATREAMQGHWFEYGREEKIVGGPTVWTKTSS